MLYLRLRSIVSQRILLSTFIRNKTDSSTRFDSLKTRMATSKYAQLPKVELHLHADGACRVDTLRDLARQHHLAYPYDDPVKFRDVVTLPHAVPSLADFLKVFAAIGDCLCTKEALERIAYEYCEDCHQQNIVYAEYRFNPFPGRDGLPSGRDYVDGILAGLKRGQEQFGVKVRCILCFKREDPGKAHLIVELARDYHDRGVVGVDIAGNELLPMDQRHIDAFQKAKKLGLHVTVHAGESGPASNVREAIEVLGAERIGHGYHVLDDEAVYQLAKEKKIHFEICPSSSIFTNSATLDSHAARRFATDGVSFSINTDDPGVIHCTLTGEYDITETQIGLTREQIKQTVLSAVGAAFLPEDEKQDLRLAVLKQIGAWELELTRTSSSSA